MLAIFLFAIATASASDVNDTLISSEDSGEIELTQASGIDEKTAQEGVSLAQTDNKGTLSVQTDTGVLGADSATYSDLAVEISNPGNIKLNYKNYTYNNGATAITISEDNKVIDGNGATIDMAGSSIHAFHVTASGVTIKNMAIKNVNCNGHYGAIKFDKSGTLINCDFTNNSASRYGGAVGFMSDGIVINCNFANNQVTSWGSAIYFDSPDATCTVKNCNFTNNKAANWGATVYFSCYGTVSNCNFINNSAVQYGGAITFKSDGSVSNCNFTNNSISTYGAAIYFNGPNGTCTVTNCDFTGNKATTEGGIIFFSSYGNLTKCNFTDNSANKDGAVIFKSDGEVSMCNFISNKAVSGNGGAVYFMNNKGNVTNCNFADNSANAGGAIFSQQEYTTADACIFKTSSDTNINTVIYPPTLNVDNFTTFYGSGEKLTFDLKTNSGISVTNGNISISLYFKDNDRWVGNYTCLSGEGWIPDLPVGSYYAILNTEYAEFKPINRTITVNKAKTEVFADSITATYNTNKDLIITLKDKNGNPVAGVSLSVDLSGAKNYITDKNGQVKIGVGKLTPKTYNVKVTFGENENYLASSANVKVTVKKAKSKITAKKKTFKKSSKVKKYTAVLKSGKTPIKKAKLTLKIKGKTYKATTNKKGKATFKIKLTKKGKFKATIKYKGNKYFKAITKKVKITIK